MRRRIFQAMVAVALLALAAGTTAAQSCPGDNNGDGVVTVDEILSAVTSALQGCPEPGERFVDNLDGTITDNETGLMWEKKVKLDSTEDLANLQDADNRYPWSGRCSMYSALGSANCQPDAASEAACLAGVEGNSVGCSQCTGGEGTCTVALNGTIWQWLNDLNTANYGGHNDWRVPRLDELRTIVDAENRWPAVNVAFHGASCGAVCTDVNHPTCSCTVSGSYWSALTDAIDPVGLFGPSGAFYVGFDTGFVDFFGVKTRDRHVRAVRGGS